MSGKKRSETGRQAKNHSTIIFTPADIIKQNMSADNEMAIEQSPSGQVRLQDSGCKYQPSQNNCTMKR